MPSNIFKQLSLGAGALVLQTFSALCSAESVDVKYRGVVDLRPFACESINRSSVVRRVCYDRPKQYMLISLNGTYYHYCRIDAGTVSQLLKAESAGRYYNANIKGRFDCRLGGVPPY